MDDPDTPNPIGPPLTPPEPSPADELIRGALPGILSKARVVITPYPFGVGGNDNLRIVCYSSINFVKVTIHGRLVIAGREALPFSFVHTGQGDRQATTEDFVLGTGLVTNLSVFGSGANNPIIGQVFVIIQLIRNIGGQAFVMGTLLQGYITNRQGLGWPGSPIENSIDGEGAVKAIVGTSPAAGAEIVETVPNGARWEVLSFVARLVTSAAAGVRQSALAYQFPTFAFMSSVNPSSAGPGSFMDCGWAPGFNFAAPVANFRGLAPLPIGAKLLPGQTIQTQTLNLDAGDQWQTPFYQIREWLESQ